MVGVMRWPVSSALPPPQHTHTHELNLFPFVQTHTFPVYGVRWCRFWWASGKIIRLLCLSARIIMTPNRTFNVFFNINNMDILFSFSTAVLFLLFNYSFLLLIKSTLVSLLIGQHKTAIMEQSNFYWHSLNIGKHFIFKQL